MLNYCALHKVVRDFFLKVNDMSKRKCSIKLADILMSGYAVFSLKYPSLLQFEQSVSEDIIKHNIKSVFKMDRIPSDTQMRERLDEIDYNILRKLIKKLFAHFQRSGKLEHFKNFDKKYFMSLDGTGFYSSKSVHCDNCCEKQHRDGSKSYYHQMLAAAIVHPDHKEVLSFAPEPIMKRDGANKNDCGISDA